VALNCQPSPKLHLTQSVSCRSDPRGPRQSSGRCRSVSAMGPRMRVRRNAFFWTKPRQIPFDQSDELPGLDRAERRRKATIDGIQGRSSCRR
jgi:hypothetical protein